MCMDLLTADGERPEGLVRLNVVLIFWEGWLPSYRFVVTATLR